ncbi:hypothetical protein [Mycobacterium scrofulaceum]|uniref:DUF732 domain-containing protein n=1 Tax=Mycobacterium scrofulaceum TaxID=1783 RepID=A0A1A2TGK0_MYCSC|nr:hypothetical protein [Mycobacterium scrofulaceum]OBH75561.1 hypothetical protein A5681_10720 [Mycobacterium scrofulaceum]OBI07076.1 hypothetical protein A5679_11585 [Mycobacterium scrofulaceum]
MKTHLRARGLLAGAVTVLALTGGTGVAQADSGDPTGPNVLNQLITSTPALNPAPGDENGPTVDSNAVGMYCENRFARCH